MCLDYAIILRQRDLREGLTMPSMLSGGVANEHLMCSVTTMNTFWSKKTVNRGQDLR